MKPDICIYHAPCQDGFAAAWAVWKRWGDAVEYAPGVYGQDPPDVAAKHVLIVDFSYKRPVLEAMARMAASITILDHHKTAQVDLAPFAVAGIEALEAPPDLAEIARFAGRSPIQAVFDMERSGAMLAWTYAYAGETAPLLVMHVQDRDLWRFDFPATRAVTACLFSLDYSFERFDAFARALKDDAARAGVVAQGAAILRKQDKDVRELLAQTRRPMVIGGVGVEVANLPYTLASDAANLLAEVAPFGACYFDRNDGMRIFSLRSKEGGADVAEIAARYGGGGHARAAGFQAPAGWEGDAA